MTSALHRPGLLAFVRWEWALQRRTLRFRLAVGLYLATVPLPAVVLLAGGTRIFGAAPGPVSFLIWTQMIQVLLSVVLGCALGGNRVGLRDREELWPVLSASPLSNAGYGLRRSVALALLLVPIVAAGTAIAAALAIAAGASPVSLTRWLVVWFLMIYLPAALAATSWRTLASASGSEMIAAILALVCMKTIGMVSAWTKETFGRPLGLADDIFGFGGFQWALVLIGRFESRRRSGFGGIASEAPFDIGTFVSQWWIEQGVTLGFLLAVSLAVPFWLGRTKRDLPPLRLAEDHWLRSLGPKLYGFVQRLVPDAGLREARWLTFVVLGVAIVAPWQHMRHGAWVLGEAQRRFTAEQHHGSLPVTDPNVATATWRSTGWLSRDQLELRWSAEFSLAESPGVAEEPAAGLQLAFTFHPHLDAGDFVVEKVSASGEWEPADEWALTDSERHWDRWLMKLVPRPEVGERFRLSGSLKGRAADLVFILRGEDGASFSTLWDDYQNRRAPFRRSDLTKSRLAPAVTNRGVQLRAEMLGLVPRYSTWELTPKPVLVGERGWDVPEESSSAGAKVELDLTFLPELTLEDRLSSGEVAPPLSIASTCGGMSKVADLGEPVRLVDSCAMPVHELQILGGRWVRLGELPVLAAASSRHERKLRSMLPELQQTIAASSKAWPGYSGIDRLAVVEQAPELVLGGRGMMLRIWEWSRPESLGRLVRFGEHHMAADGLLDPAAILDGILGTEVAASRRLDPDQRYMLRSFLSSLMKRRMGVAKRNAILGQGKPAWYAVQLKRPLLGLHPYHGIALAHKVPAVVLQLERRVGIDTLVAAVADLLSRETEDAATAEELFELLEARSGEDLDGFFQDFFVNGSLPELSLEDVRVIPRHGGFRVVGAVANAADGQVDCPVVVRTDGPELRQDVIVPSRGRGEFSFDVDVRPQVAILDPQGLCLRLFGGGGMGAEQVPLR